MFINIYYPKLQYIFFNPDGKKGNYKKKDLLSRFWAILMAPGAFSCGFLWDP